MTEQRIRNVMSGNRHMKQAWLLSSNIAPIGSPSWVGQDLGRRLGIVRVGEFQSAGDA
jgi:hypothetical protein